MNRRGVSSAALAFLVVALVIVGSAAAVAIQNNPPATSGSHTFTSQSISTTASQNGLRFTLAITPTAATSGASVVISVSDFNTLPSNDTLAPGSLPTVGGTGLSVGPCSQLPLGVGIIQGYYDEGNLSKATLLGVFEPGVYSCPVEFAAAYYSFAPKSDEVSLYSQQPTGSANSTAPRSMWTNPDLSSQNFSGYWTSSADVLGGGSFQPFRPGVYTVVGADEWGQLAVLHFVIGSSGTTTRSSGTTSTGTGTGGSGFAASVQGLQLRMALNATVLRSGETLQVALQEFNTLATANNVTAARDWPIQVALGSCTNVFDEPIGVAVYSGHVDAQNVSGADSLQVFPIAPCPMFIRLVNGYDFQPLSDIAVVLPGTGAAPMAANINVSRIYSSQAQPLPQGDYTVAAADEWGAMAFLYFTVS